MNRNFVFISPTFPPNYYQFPERWKNLGGNALCIGEDDYDHLSDEMKNACTEYYKVNNMHNYDEMYRAVAWFAHKYGKIDWLESNNEYWLEQDAKLRTDFNITSGEKENDVFRFRLKSNMKAYYKKAGASVARYHLTSSLEEGKAFIKEVGYPVIVKPDNGMGAGGTWKINNEKELKEFYEMDLATQYIMEEFIPGYIVSFDGITDQNGKIIYKTSHTFPNPIMEIVNNADECFYYSEIDIPKDLDEIGEKVIKAFGIKGRFFHTEYFRLSEEKKGLGKKNDLIALEVNMRPPGGYTPDMMNFASDIDVYQIYAEMAMTNNVNYDKVKKYHTVYTGKRDGFNYKNSDEAIYKKYANNIMMNDRMPDIIAEAMGNEFYIARFKTISEVEDFMKYIFMKKGKRK